MENLVSRGLVGEMRGQPSRRHANGRVETASVFRGRAVSLSRGLIRRARRRRLVVEALEEVLGLPSRQPTPFHGH